VLALSGFTPFAAFPTLAGTGSRATAADNPDASAPLADSFLAHAPAEPVRNVPLLQPRGWATVAGLATATAAAVGFSLHGLGGALAAVGGVAAIGVLGVGAVAASIYAYGQQDHQRSADCIIVLGTSARPDGTPGPALAARTRHAEDLFRSGVAPAIIFTGGRGAAGHAESDAAIGLARQDGLPSDHLFAETSSTNTWENFERAKEVMKAHHFTSCIISTDPFHAHRSVQIARELGIDAVSSPAAASPRQKPHDLYRETLSTLQYWNYRLDRALHR
jgi:uncharacterized SAM-binding protein YcdF (DUF218 family)